ncbi:MAG: conserved phage C-terminal domain-containing protein, partial [Planctomycetota bacterium]
DFDVNNPGILTVSCQYLLRNLQVSRQKFVKIVTFFEKYPKNNGKIYVEFNGDLVTLNCPRLKELCDEYTEKLLSKLSGQNRDSVGSLSLTSRARTLEVEVEVEVEVEREKENTLPPISPVPGDIIVEPPKPTQRKTYHKPKEISPEAQEVLDYLNKVSGKNFTVCGNIQARLNDGRTIEECKKVIDIKWADIDFDKKYFNQDTLFWKSKFDKYINQTPLINSNKSKTPLLY